MRGASADLFMSFYEGETGKIVLKDWNFLQRKSGIISCSKRDDGVLICRSDCEVTSSYRNQNHRYNQQQLFLELDFINIAIIFLRKKVD